ncbi:MAG: hypothetical protein JXR83_08190, partial [Deltaproteobacteria bacterium]|nr:hypothetical protein [Deltaproteobacteria bacterium]
RYPALAGGGAHTCAVASGGDAWCWGDNERGQLGVGDTLTRGSVPGDMAYLPAVELEPSGSATHVAVGDNHACAVLGGHGIKCWGWNYEGQLGQGDTIARGDQIGELGASLPPVALASDQEVYAITAGANHTCALLADGSVYCWGDNACGQLGLGDTEHRGDDPDEMGSRLPAVQIGEP